MHSHILQARVILIWWRGWGRGLFREVILIKIKIHELKEQRSYLNGFEGLYMIAEGWPYLCHSLQGSTAQSYKKIM